MESLLVWGLGLLALALFVLALEFFIPSAGVLGVTAAVLAIVGVVCLYKYDPMWGAIGTLIVVILGPASLYFGLKVWPHTPLGRRIIGVPSEEEVASRREAEEGERRAREAFLGKQGRVLTDLRPVGVIEIDGARHDALSETMYIPAGSVVRVVSVEGAQLRVRQVT